MKRFTRRIARANWRTYFRARVSAFNRFTNRKHTTRNSAFRETMRKMFRKKSGSTLTMYR